SAVIQISSKRAGTGGCGASRSQDSGASVEPDGTNVSNGADGVSGRPQTLIPGQYMLCGWVIDGNGDPEHPIATASAIVTVSAAETLSLAAGDGDPVEGRPFDVSATGAAFDPAASAYATTKTGGSCASSPFDDGGEQLLPGGAGVNGSFSIAVA